VEKVKIPVEKVAITCGKGGEYVRKNQVKNKNCKESTKGVNGKA